MERPTRMGLPSAFVEDPSEVVRDIGYLGEPIVVRPVLPSG